MKFAVVLLLAMIAVASVDALLPLRTLEKRLPAAPGDACTNNPCGSGETCCLVSGGQAGCCPAANACCCPDQAHCCKSPYQCVCSGTCPGSGCSCTGCSSSGQCQSSVVF